MKRDIELIRKILFTIEEQYHPGEGQILCLKVEGYDLKTIAEHCSLLFQQGLITNYKASWGDDTIQTFLTGNLSSNGYDYLELIRNDQVWKKTTDEIKKKKLPQTIEEIARVAGIFTGQVIKELNS